MSPFSFSTLQAWGPFLGLNPLWIFLIPVLVLYPLYSFLFPRLSLSLYFLFLYPYYCLSYLCTSFFLLLEGSQCPWVFDLALRDPSFLALFLSFYLRLTDMGPLSFCRFQCFFANDCRRKEKRVNAGAFSNHGFSLGLRTELQPTSTWSPSMAPNFFNPVSISSSLSLTTTRVLSLLTLEVMDPAPIWE